MTSIKIKPILLTLLCFGHLAAQKAWIPLKDRNPKTMVLDENEQFALDQTEELSKVIIEKIPFDAKSIFKYSTNIQALLCMSQMANPEFNTEYIKIYKDKVKLREFLGERAFFYYQTQANRTIDLINNSISSISDASFDYDTPNSPVFKQVVYACMNDERIPQTKKTEIQSAYVYTIYYTALIKHIYSFKFLPK